MNLGAEPAAWLVGLVALYVMLTVLDLGVSFLRRGVRAGGDEHEREAS